MANKTISQLTAKTTPADADVLPLEDTEDTKKINYSALADAILNKLTSKTYTVAGSSQTLIAAINALNSNSWLLANSTNAFISSNSDLNNFKTPGIYDCNSSSVASSLVNCPISTGFRLIVTQTGYGSFSYGTQIIMAASGVAYPREFRRILLGAADTNTWSEWYTVQLTSN